MQAIIATKPVLEPEIKLCLKSNEYINVSNVGGTNETLLNFILHMDTSKHQILLPQRQLTENEIFLMKKTLLHYCISLTLAEDEDAVLNFIQKHA